MLSLYHDFSLHVVSFDELFIFDNLDKPPSMCPIIIFRI